LESELTTDTKVLLDRIEASRLQYKASNENFNKRATDLATELLAANKEFSRRATELANSPSLFMESEPTTDTKVLLDRIEATMLRYKAANENITRSATELETDIRAANEDFNRRATELANEAQAAQAAEQY
jgi:hypothetical protein